MSTTPAPPTVLITLATGKQGRATTTALLALGATVHALVRDPSSPTAQALSAQPGVTLFPTTDAGIAAAAATSCTSLFLNVLNWPTIPDPAAEARRILDLLIAKGSSSIHHVVVSTSGWAGSPDKWDTPTNRASWLAEYNRHEMAVEAVVKEKCESWTILRPFWFYANYALPTAAAFYPGLYPRQQGDSGEDGDGDGGEVGSSRELIHSFDDPHRTVFPHIDVADIGRVAAMALCDPAKFHGREIELAGKNVTVEEAADAIRRVTGWEVQVRRRTAEEEQRDEEVVPWQRWASEVDLTVDVGALEREFGLRFATFEEFLRRERAEWRFV